MVDGMSVEEAGFRPCLVESEGKSERKSAGIGLPKISTIRQDFARAANPITVGIVCKSLASMKIHSTELGISAVKKNNSSLLPSNTLLVRMPRRHAK